MGGVVHRLQEAVEPVGDPVRAALGGGVAGQVGRGRGPSDRAGAVRVAAVGGDRAAGAGAEAGAAGVGRRAGRRWGGAEHVGRGGVHVDLGNERLGCVDLEAVYPDGGAFAGLVGGGAVGVPVAPVAADRHVVLAGCDAGQADLVGAGEVDYHVPGVPAVGVRRGGRLAGDGRVGAVDLDRDRLGRLGVVGSVDAPVLDRVDALAQDDACGRVGRLEASVERVAG